MFLKQTMMRNARLIETSFAFHQSGKILPDTYVVDLDQLLSNATFMLNKAKKQNIELYFMLKQLGRNPYIAKKLCEAGFEGAVVVDFKEANVMMRENIPICNVGHLVQMPKFMVEKLVNYGCKYFTVFSIEKLREINQAAKNKGIIQKVLLKVVGLEDKLYSGQIAGFRLETLAEQIEIMKTMKHIQIAGVTSFPCFLYDDTSDSIMPTNNLDTLLKAKQILQTCGIVIENINAPSATCSFTLEQMRAYPVTSGEPGHGLTGTTPLHAYRLCDEIPCVTYVSEVSHNFDAHAYCYGGGHYRRSHVAKALVGTSMEDYKEVDIIPPTDESIDYYFEIPTPCRVSDTVIMAFRFQIFVTRSHVALVEGIQSKAPHIVGIYNSSGDECHG